MRAFWSAMRSGSITPALAAAATQPLDGREAATRSTRSRRAASRASRSRASSARRNSGACRFIVTPAVLVPRPETETVVEAGARAARSRRSRARPLRIADLGTGSGAILLALLSELPNAHGVGTDIDADALDGRARAMRGSSALASARDVSRVRLRRGARRPVRSGRLQSALCRERRHRGARAARCATTIRAMRSTAARTGSRPIGRSPPMRRVCSARRASRGRDRRRAGARRRATCSRPSGLAIAAGPPRPLGHRPGGAPADSRISDNTEQFRTGPRGQKTAWNVAKDRLGSVHGIDPRLGDALPQEARSEAP